MYGGGGGGSFFVKLCCNVLKKPTILLETSKIVFLSRGNRKPLKRFIMLNRNYDFTTLFYKNPDRHIKNQESTSTHLYLTLLRERASHKNDKQWNRISEAAHNSIGSSFRAYSHYPVCGDILPRATNISVHSCMAFHPACREMKSKVFLLAPAKRVHFSHAAQHAVGGCWRFSLLFA